MHIAVTFYGSLKCFALIKVMCFDTALLKDVYKGIHLFSIYFWPAAEKNGLKGSLCKLFGIQYIPLSMQTFTLVMMTSSNGNIFRVTGPLCGNSPVPGEFPSQRPVTRSFDVFVDLPLNKRRHRWFETPSHRLWRHSNVLCCGLGPVGLAFASAASLVPGATVATLTNRSK